MLDLSEDQLRSRVIRPYDFGKTMMVNGRSVRPEEVFRLTVCRSGEPAEQVAALDRAQDRVLIIPGPSDAERVIHRADNVTDVFVKGPPGWAALKRTSQPRRKGARVFIVHGRDELLKASLEAMLLRFGLHPIVLNRQPDEGLTLEEKLERHADVNYACVLLTPDEVAHLVGAEDQTPDHRPRPNVLYELGFFVGRLTRSRVCCIARKGVDMPSDLRGLVLKWVDRTVDEIELPLFNELKNAGLKPLLDKHEQS